MRLKKHRPGCAPSSLGCRLDALALAHIGDRAAANLVSQVKQRSLNARVAPAWILQCHAHNQFRDDAHRARPPWLAPGAEVELASNELPVPAQQRIGRDDRTQFKQNLARDAKALFWRAAPFPGR